MKRFVRTLKLALLLNMALTQTEISHRYYAMRKTNGLCPKCGKQLDREGHYCSKCVEKFNRYQRETRELRRLIGICPTCGKEKLFGDEKQCITCRQKAHESRTPLTDEQKEKYKKRFNEQQKGLREERKAAGICTRCGKRAVAPGRKKCEVCLEKDAELHRRKSKVNIIEYRRENNLCFFCGEPVDRKEVRSCKKCSQKFSEKRRKRDEK